MKLDEIIGVIFDFNGTCVFDGPKHIEAWKLYVEEIAGGNIDTAEAERYIRTHGAKEILEHYLGYEISTDMEFQLTEEKEGIYRKLCREDPGFSLAPGLPQFLDYLTEYKIPRTIATATCLSNISFYFERFDLYRWFDPEKIAERHGKLRDKPFPDLYLTACKLINKAPERCLVFEDSAVGIQAAQSAGIKHIVAVTGDNPTLPAAAYAGIEQTIHDYTELTQDKGERK